jgi:hypothetical protein
MEGLRSLVTAGPPLCARYAKCDSRSQSLLTAPRSRCCELAPDVEWQEHLDLDSMNVLSVMVGVEEATGVSVPERDSDKESRLDRCVAYLSNKLAVRT